MYLAIRTPEVVKMDFASVPFEEWSKNVHPEIGAFLRRIREIHDRQEAAQALDYDEAVAGDNYAARIDRSARLPKTTRTGAC
jgi:hypothetical protein